MLYASGCQSIGSRTSQVDTKRQSKSRKSISNRTLINITLFLSQQYGLLPCFYHHDPLQMTKYRQLLSLSKSSNAFWHRTRKLKSKVVHKKQLRKNSTNSTRSHHFQKFRKSIIQRFKRNNERKMPSMSTQSEIYKHNTVKSNTTITVHPSNTTQSISHQLSSSQPYSSNDSYRLDLQDNFYDENQENKNYTLEMSSSLFKIEQQNINATKNNINQTIQEISQTITNDLHVSKSSAQTPDTSPKNNTRNTSTRSTAKSLRRKKSNKQKHISKRKFSSKTPLIHKNIITTFKSKNTQHFLPITGSTTSIKRMISRRSPFPNLNIFHSMPQMQNSDEITKENIHENHLCSKPITTMKGLPIIDQKKLIAHDYLTLISLLPTYLNSKGNFQHVIRDKTNISYDSALELDRLMNEWSSTRLFIGSNSYYKTLSQRI